jgi:hypothetical protein
VFDRRTGADIGGKGVLYSLDNLRGIMVLKQHENLDKFLDALGISLPGVNPTSAPYQLISG